MKSRLMKFAGVLALLAVLGRFYAQPLMAQVRAALVEDVDNPGRNPFQATVTININNFNDTPVTVPSGKRLVVDYVTMSGAVTPSPSGLAQPIIILNSSVAGSDNALYYIAPQPSQTVSQQFYHTEKTAIYADSLSVGPAFSGFTPSFMAFNVVISGHLINLP